MIRDELGVGWLCPGCAVNFSGRVARPRPPAPKPCPVCGVPVFWVASGTLAGIAVEAEPAADGKIMLTMRPDGLIEGFEWGSVGVLDGHRRRRSHFYACPELWDRFRASESGSNDERRRSQGEGPSGASR